MIGAIVGDIAGSPYEFHPWQGDWQDVPLFIPESRFTDDTVLTLAVANALRRSKRSDEKFRELLTDNLKEWPARYPHRGYGGRFRQWYGSADRQPYNSLGNGSAMRVSPVGWAFDTLADVERFAAMSAEATHNHPEGIKGAQAVAGSIFLARTGASKDSIKEYVASTYGYDLDRTLEQIRQTYRFDETCPGSVPEAIIAFLESDDFEQTVRKCIWLRGDADTQAAIAGGIAEAFFGIPDNMAQQALNFLDEPMRLELAEWQEFLA